MHRFRWQRHVQSTFYQYRAGHTIYMVCGTVFVFFKIVNIERQKIALYIVRYHQNATRRFDTNVLEQLWVTKWQFNQFTNLSQLKKTMDAFSITQTNVEIFVLVETNLFLYATNVIIADFIQTILIFTFY
jgi:hypothetical protein